ncbi:MAG: molybdopterin-dependent oxidoreductase [Desulfobacterales bacterium]
MSSINITINGQEIAAAAGQTVLEAATAAGIEIPTLCHHPALKPVGACRVCLVEVKGQRTLQPACTFPIAPRMVVQTESPKVVEARKFVLELIFSERNHFCMFCEMSGDCELQKLGYRYGLDHWMYPTYTQNFPVDASPPDFLLDHNRCVLCRRCIRACSELAANHTLDLRQRGALTMLTADMNACLGQSSCISCGVCLDVCPTGALVDKRSAFAGRDCNSEHIAGICSQCSLGCGMEMVVRAGHILRIRGRWDAPVNGGVLCRKGRFQALDDNRRRILSPLKRLDGHHLPTDWESAIQLAAERIAATAAERLGLLSTTGATNEALKLLSNIFRRRLQTRQLKLLNPVVPRLPSLPKGILADLSRSDCILLAGADPAVSHPVASMLIKRAVDRGCRLIVVEDEASELATYADEVFKTGEVNQALYWCRRARQPVVVYGNGVLKKTLRLLQQLDKAAFIALQPGVNTYAAAALELNQQLDFSALEVLYILVGEQDEGLDEIAGRISAGTFVVVQACYPSALTERADVVLPMATWPERSGRLTSTDGIIQKTNAVRTPRGESKPDFEILRLLAEKLGSQPQVPMGEMASITERTFLGKENPTWPR